MLSSIKVFVCTPRTNLTSFLHLQNGYCLHFVLRAKEIQWKYINQKQIKYVLFWKKLTHVVVWIRLTWKKNGTMDVEDDEDCREIKKKISQEVHKMAQGSRTESNQ
jgi:hypothetical protein